MTAIYQPAPQAPNRFTRPRPYTEQTFVTPKMASEWLENNEVNRKIRAGVVDMYARDMASGNWELTGESIKFSPSGRLLDGQHRLTALVQSGTPVLMFVTHDVPDTAQRVMDCGTKRSANDILAMEGIKLAALTTSTARLAITAENGEWSHLGKRNISNSEVFDWIESNPEISEACEIASRHRTKTLCVPSIIALSSLMIYRSVGNWDEVEEFWSAASEKVGLQQGDPVIALTNRFAQDRAQRRLVPKAALLSAVLRAWNYRREGKPMSLIRYETGGTFIPVPEIIN